MDQFVELTLPQYFHIAIDQNTDIGLMDILSLQRVVTVLVSMFPSVLQLAAVFNSPGSSGLALPETHHLICETGCTPNTFHSAF